ncbi:MAG: hypothetical protein IJ649_08525 [Oscillospiraceae bacterium]|nr:hypothetical protein [Oscillospiraceae bacterium]
MEHLTVVYSRVKVKKAPGVFDHTGSLRLSKNLQKGCEYRAAGELEGVKTRLEYNNPSSEKPDISGFSGNRILTIRQNARREKRSQKSLAELF